jgi:transcriptional regulator with XRE-family HTH domain
VVSIRAFREVAGLTLDQLARRIADQGYPITKAGLGNIETGTRGPSQEFLEAWARTFAITETPRTIDRAPRAAATKDAA